MFKMLLATASVCVLAGCSSGADTSSAKAEISKVADVK
jgi:outer membrane murein-binding lipoprotein Lpp